MQEVVTFQHSAAHTTTWTVPKDTNIVGLSQSASLLVSYDVNDTVTNATTPTANRVIDTFVFYSNTTGLKQISPIPIKGGSTLYVSTSAAGTSSLFLDDFVGLSASL